MSLSNNYDSKNTSVAVKRYLCMSQKGTVVFAEETEILFIVRFFHEKGNLEEALKAITLGIEQFSYSVDLYLYKATLLIEQEQDDEVVLTYIDRALDLVPNSPRVLLLKAEVLSNAEQFDEAENILDFIMTYADKAELEQIHLLKAFIYDHQEQFDDMFDSLKEALFINPRNAEALTQMWLAAAYSERYEDSVAVHEAVLDEDPYSFQAWQNLGHAHSGLKNLEEAIFAYEYSTITNPENEFGYLDWALACVEANRHSEALEVYKEVEQRFGATADLQAKIGLCHQHLDNYISASKYYAKALRADEENHEAHYRMGECLMVQNDYQNAIEAFQRAIKLKPQLEEYHLALAKSYEESGDFENARDAYDRLIEVAPECPEHWLYQVDFFCKIRNFAEALETLENAELNIPRSAYLLYHRAVCFFRMGNRNEAMLWLQEALLEDYAMHSRIFMAVPTLEKDKDVLDLIRTFR